MWGPDPSPRASGKQHGCGHAGDDRLANGGYSPAANVQLATDTESRAILGVSVSNESSDSAGLSEPMREQVEQRTGGKVKQHLIDGATLRIEDREAQQKGWSGDSGLAQLPLRELQIPPLRCAPIGMTKERAAIPTGVVAVERTADPSTTLRFGRDDKGESGDSGLP